MQSLKNSDKLNFISEVILTKEEVPLWNEDFPFWNSINVELENKNISFRRIVMPMHNDSMKMGNWLKELDVDAVVCSGSRRNVSIWEEWMSPAGLLIKSSSKSGIPTLGICFGHQLLCHSLGGKIERADSLSSGIWELELTHLGEDDELLSSHLSEDDNISGLYTHQDHVASVSDCCSILGKTTHNLISAVRVNDDAGNPLPAWGLQFHPEAARKRIKRAYEWGHISEEEYKSFKGEHDGASILSSFANIVLKNDNQDSI